MPERPAGPAPRAHASLGDTLAGGWDEPDGALPPDDWGRRRGPRPLATVWLFALFTLALAAGHAWLGDRLTGEAFLAWATVFTAISLQALPFLVFGVALSAALTAFVPASFYRRVMPANPFAAVPAAGAAGMVLPGCECASVPVAGGLIKRGVAPAAALTFLLAAPAINPVVLVATAVAFAGQPEMVLARLAASFGAAVVVGWVWARLGRTDWLRPPRSHHSPDAPRWQVFRESMLHDLMHAGGFLVLGALAAATVNVAVPREWVAAVADMPVVSVLVLALFAIVLSVCSEADAFVAVSLTEFSPMAKLAFLVVGPMVDLKLIALQGGTFGWSFVRRFVPLTLAAALVFTFVIGGLLL
ncbi:permease [Streptomonospora litoralis]|uniref:Putative permease n=1 Tax=Streptomonospora litoralis TaxID=2498135 RepID=A0A4P6Q285_9ACTN|nr:permease [Streptomonospora litoralis]QBI54665.1 putative permease [Streptomonospora litoralis]